jgi:hypothetical protein
MNRGAENLAFSAECERCGKTFCSNEPIRIWSWCEPCNDLFDELEKVLGDRFWANEGEGVA